MKKKGIDISYHQGKVNYKAVKSSGVEFVILREGFRNSIDTKFLEYAKGFKGVGLPILGVYHFSYALNEDQAIKEADLCIKNLEKAGLDKETIIFFDFEYDTVSKAKKNGVVLASKDCRNHTLAFCKRVESKGYRAGIYMNNDYRINWYKNESWLKDYEIWLADYTGEPDADCMIQQYKSTGKVTGISGNVDMNYQLNVKKPIVPNDNKNQNEVKEMNDRERVVDLAKSWIGKNEKDGSHKYIIDIYNSQKKLPRSYRMKYSDSWCAATVSAIAIKLGLADIMPVECSCNEIIKKAKTMGCWVEKDSHVPKPGDLVLYDWNDTGKGDNTGWPDHIGIVEKVDEKKKEFVVIEGNKNDRVERRTMAINGKMIRGFVCPKYKSEPKKETEPANKKQVLAYKQPESKSESYDHFYVTTTDLHLRNGAGKSNKSMIVIPKGKKVACGGRYTKYDGVAWLYVKVTINNVVYKGFCSSKYLKKA